MDTKLVLGSYCKMIHGYSTTYPLFKHCRRKLWNKLRIPSTLQTKLEKWDKKRQKKLKRKEKRERKRNKKV